LGSSDFKFLLPYTLLYEIYTADRRHEKNLEKLRLIDQVWLRDMPDALRWEIVKGESSRKMPKLPPILSTVGVSNIQRLRKEYEDDIRQYETMMADLASFHSSEAPDENPAELCRMQRKEFFRYLDDYLASQEVRKEIAESARYGYSEFAASEGLTISSAFLPQEDWLSFGMELCISAYKKWKLWRVGDGIADPRKPQNAMFDLRYIASMALADGIITGETDILRIAWLCWPEKRKNILRYIGQKGDPITFQPDW
jgi:hypothetical protein